MKMLFVAEEPYSTRIGRKFKVHFRNCDIGNVPMSSILDVTINSDGMIKEFKILNKKVYDDVLSFERFNLESTIFSNHKKIFYCLDRCTVRARTTA